MLLLIISLLCTTPYQLYPIILFVFTQIHQWHCICSTEIATLIAFALFQWIYLLRVPTIHFYFEKKNSKLKLYSCCLQRTKLHKSISFIIQKHSMQRKHIYRRHLIEIEKHPLKLSVSTFYWLLNSKKKGLQFNFHNNLIYDKTLKRIDYFFCEKQEENRLKYFQLNERFLISMVHENSINFCLKNNFSCWEATLAPLWKNLRLLIIQRDDIHFK